MISTDDTFLKTYQTKFDKILSDLKEVCKDSKLDSDLAMDLCSKMETALFQKGIPNPVFDLPILLFRYASDSSDLEKISKVYDMALVDFAKLGKILELESILENN